MGTIPILLGVVLLLYGCDVTSAAGSLDALADMLQTAEAEVAQLMTEDARLKKDNEELEKEDEKLKMQSDGIREKNDELKKNDDKLSWKDDLLWKAKDHIESKLHGMKKKDNMIWELVEDLKHNDTKLMDKDWQLMKKDQQLMDDLAELIHKLRDRFAFYTFARRQVIERAGNIEFNAPVTDHSFCYESTECPCKTQKAGVYLIQLDIEQFDDDEPIMAALRANDGMIPGAGALRLDREEIISCQVIVKLDADVCISVRVSEAVPSTDDDPRRFRVSAKLSMFLVTNIHEKTKTSVLFKNKKNRFNDAAWPEEVEEEEVEPAPAPVDP